MARTIPIQAVPAQAAQAPADGLGCHAGADQMLEAARTAGKSEVLDQYAKDYPRKADAGPHDQPQSMCPAFGSLRVGLRMKRTATILSGSACCVYGLTFTSHFYGARRSVGYVPFNSETLVTGKLFEDIREAVHAEADPNKVDSIVIINLCVPTASGVPLQLLPKEINGVRIIGIDVPGFGVPTHAEAKDVLAGAMLKYAREEVMNGPVASPKGGRSAVPTVALLGEMFPADPVIMCDGVVNRIDPAEIGFIHRVLAARPGAGVLTQRIFERCDCRIQNRNHRQPERTATLFELDPDLGIGEGKEDEARVGPDLAHDPVKVLLRADHRPEVAVDLGPFELGQGGLGQHLQRFAGRIRQQVEMQARHGRTIGPLWTNGLINHGMNRGTSSAGQSLPASGVRIGLLWTGG